MIKRTKIRSNGITLLSEQNQSAGSVTAALFFKSGLLWEKEKEYGVTLLRKSHSPRPRRRDRLPDDDAA